MKPARIIVRWSARLLSVLSVGVMLLFVLAEGLNPLSLRLGAALLFVLFPLGVALGMVLDWWRELPRGVVAALCPGLFYLVHLVTAGRLPRGLFFFLFSLPGFLFIISWALSRTQRTTGTIEPPGRGDAEDCAPHP